MASRADTYRAKAAECDQALRRLGMILPSRPSFETLPVSGERWRS
jgi:hypothetical protein